jgi:hypothetical protein
VNENRPAINGIPLKFVPVSCRPDGKVVGALNDN